MTSRAMEELKKLKGAGIAAAIILIILGICLFINPIASSAVMIWLLVIGVLISGIEKIVSFIKMPKGQRDGFLLASGILWLFLSLLLIARGLNFGFAVTAAMETGVAIMIGFLCIFSGIGRICISGQVGAMGGSTGLTVLTGILEILCGMAVLSAPLVGVFTLTLVFGIFMLVMGISLLIKCISL